MCMIHFPAITFDFNPDFRCQIQYTLYCITGSPEGLSRVNGVRRSSAETWNFNPSPKAQFYINLFQTFGVGDYVREVTNPDKVGSGPMSGRDATWGTVIFYILQQSYSPYPWTNFRAQ